MNMSGSDADAYIPCSSEDLKKNYEDLQEQKGSAAQSAVSFRRADTAFEPCVERVRSDA